MSLKQRLDRLAKAPSVANCHVCALWNPIRVFKLKDADDEPPAWPSPDDPRECPRCGKPRTFVSIRLYPHAHPAGRLAGEQGPDTGRTV